MMSRTLLFVPSVLSGSINPITVLSLILTKTSPCISQFVCTGVYFPIPAGIEHCSLAYTRAFSSTPSFNTLIVIFSCGILQAWVDISCSLVALHIVLKAEPSFTGINATSLSVHTNLRLFSCKNAISKFTL